MTVNDEDAAGHDTEPGANGDTPPTVQREMPRTRRLSGLDAVFLAAEGPPNYVTHTMAVMVLDPRTMLGGDPVNAVKDYVRARIHLVPPLQRRLVPVPFGLDVPKWIDDPHIDLDHHIQKAGLPTPVTDVELAAFVSALAERKLDRHHPLWEMYVVEGFEGDRLCVVAKLHHSLMDGGAGMQFMASLFALEPDSGTPSTPGTLMPVGRPGGLAQLACALRGIVLRPLAGARAVEQTLVAGVRVSRQLLDNRRRGGSLPTIPFSAPRLLFDAPVTPRRQIAFTSIPLDEVKGLAKDFGVTINDVVLAVVAGALRSFLISLGTLPDKPLVAAVPVSVHGDHGVEEANMVSLMLADLSTNLEDPADRLLAIHRRASESKLIQSAMGSEAILSWLDVPVPALFSGATSLYSRLRLSALHPPMCNLVVSDVPGPSMPLYFAGARLESIFPLGPIFDGVGLNITAVSSATMLDVGLVACPDQLPDLWDLASRLRPALEELDAARSGGRRARGPQTRTRHR